MRFTLQIQNNGTDLFSVRIPPTGLVIGSDEEGHVLLPDVDSLITFSPAGTDVAFRLEKGNPIKIGSEELKSGILSDKSECSLANYTIKIHVERISTRHIDPEMSQGTATVQFDPGKSILEMTTGVIREIESAGAIKDHPIISDALTIGSDPDCEVILPDRYVSGKHVTLARNEQGYLLRDLDSTNGTFIAGTRIVEAVLLPGDEFVVGRTKLRLDYEVDRVEVAPYKEDRYCGMVGHSDKMRRIFSLIEKIAHTKATVLIEGQTGTGKELAARALHQRSPRSSGPFVALNCGAIPGDLVESELFGHIKGAFSGASADRKGLFELADCGTLFLDEINELPPMLQPKLLRVLEQSTFRKVGGEREIQVDVRIVAATNQDLKSASESKQFRNDLYYRLAMIKINLPPLLERTEDIAELAKHFIRQEAKDLELPTVPKLDAGALNLLMKHPWTGNIRELRNVLRRSLIVHDFPTTIISDDILLDETPHSADLCETPKTLDQVEKVAIAKALEECDTRRQTANLLGIAESTLYDKLKKHGLE